MALVDNGLYVDKEVIKSTSIINTVANNATATQCAPASAKRCRITFINDGANIMNVFQQNPIDPNRNIRLPVAGGILTLDKQDVGSLIQGAWFAQSAVGSSNITAIDTVEQ